MEIDGSVHPELRIDGYVDKRMVMSKTFSSDTSLDRFYVKADDSYIDGDGSDATRLVFLTMDKFGNLRPSRSGTVTMTLDGPGVIVGDNPLQLADNGGAGAVWIKARQDSAGVIKVVAGHSSLGSLSVSIHVNKVSPDPTLI
jgi:beta-galactosidase